MLLKYINKNKNWEQELAAAPYNLIIKRDNEYILFVYDIFNSDLSLEVVQEARGVIVRYDEDVQRYIRVCAPFKKFFNYGEGNAVSIGWNSKVLVREKIDGSLLKIFYDKEAWHLATNGTIDAGKAEMIGSNKTFKQGFEELVGMSVQDFAESRKLNVLSTYLFEYCSPESRVVLSYPQSLYYLTAFDNSSWDENFKQGERLFVNDPVVKLPKLFMSGKNLTLEKIVNWVANNLRENYEGVIISDEFSNRIKVKTEQYLKMAHLHNNGAVTTRRIIEMIREKTIDDYVAYFPEDKLRVDAIKSSIRQTAYTLELCKKIVLVKRYKNRKEFALEVQNNFDKPYWNYLFKIYDGKEINSYEYALNLYEKER